MDNITLQLDMLEIIFWDFRIWHTKNLDFLTWLSENSSTWVYKYFDSADLQHYNFSCVIFKIKWYSKHFSFSYRAEWVELENCFSITYWASNWAVSSSNKIAFSGAFLHYFWYDFTLRLIEYSFNTKDFLWLRRFDIALDLPEWKKNIVDSFTGIPTFKYVYDKEKWYYETYYLWNRYTGHSCIRIYDKIKDTIKKDKEWLYNFQSKDLTRIECEFLKEYIDSFEKINPWVVTYKTLLTDNKLLKDLFFQRTVNEIWYFKSVEFSKYEFKFLAPSRIDLEKYYLDTKQLPKWWEKNALWMLLKLKKIIWVEKLIWYLKLDLNDIETVLNYYITKKREVIKTKIRLKNTKDSYNKMYYEIIKDQSNFATYLTEILLQDNLAEATEITEVIKNAISKYEITYNLKTKNE